MTTTESKASANGETTKDDASTRSTSVRLMSNPYKKADSTSAALPASTSALSASSSPPPWTSPLAPSFPAPAASASASENSHAQKEEKKEDYAAPAASASALVIAASDKAGMEGIDRARIDAIIMRESKNSLYIQQQEKRDAKVNERIERLRQRLRQQDQQSPSWRRQLQNRIDRELVPPILARRPLRSTRVVVDMDMFFMACELLTRPELRNKPACVGGNMISTSNYVARRYGVRSAMAGWIGDALVRELSDGKEKLIHLDHHSELYQQKSELVRQVLSEYDPGLRAYSLDEAYMDLGPYLALKLKHPSWDHQQIRQVLKAAAAKAENEQEHTDDSTERNDADPCDDDDDDKKPTGVDESATLSASFDCIRDCMDQLMSFTPSVCLEVMGEVVKEMREQVHRATALTCSAGVAPNFLLAKIASDRNKPNGQLVVGSDHDSVVAFLHPLPTRKVSGIGRVTAKTLQAFSIQTVKDLYEQRALVQFISNPATASNLLYASLGCSSSDGRVRSEEEQEDDESYGQKGISRERTFRSGKSWTEINSKLEDIGRTLSDDMQSKSLWARTMTLKVKLHTFDCFSRSRSVPRRGSGPGPVELLQSADGLISLASELLRDLRNEFKGSTFNVRLLGIRCSNFSNRNGEQQDKGQTSISQFLCDPDDVSAQSPNQHSKSKLKPHSFVTSARSSSDSQVHIDKFLHRPRSPNARRPGLAPARNSGSVSSSSEATRTGSAVSPVVEEDGEEEVTLLVHCPVCQRAFPEQKNLELNQHVDACLNGSAVRQVVRELDSTAVRQEEHQHRKKRRGLTDFFEPTK